MMFGRANIEAIPIECNLAELGTIEIIKIVNSKDANFLIWSDIMKKYHYLGNGHLCGQQIRYLIHSDIYGCLGGFSFSSSAWSIESRDKHIGWDLATKVINLNKTVNNSRFLILPWIKVKNLASRVLSLSIKRLSEDWKLQYGIEPVLLETFVEKDRFNGGCYRAANWQFVGSTKGRGRQDLARDTEIAIKDIYLYPLKENYQEILCHNPNPIIPVKVKKEPIDWAEEEFGDVELGDNRINKRLLTIARDFYSNPQANIPQACQDRAKTKATYRFFENGNVTMEKLLLPHYKSTQNRIGKEKVVLAAQDTTSLNYSAHPATENLGNISSRKDGSLGLLVHDTMAFNLEGTPLGLINVQCWARNPEDFGKRHLRYELPIEQKESNKWLKSYRSVQEIQKQLPDTMLVSVGDREADIYELFDLARGDSQAPKLLVRAEHNRLLADGQGHLWDFVSALPLSGIQTIKIPRKVKCPAREAQLEIRFSKVNLKPPERKKGLKEISINAIIAEEKNCPEGFAPLKWMLLTTCEVNSFDDAVEKLQWYSIRWGIEIFHKTLKSGCKIEERQLGSADRIEGCLAIDMVVAWRIFHLTKLGREVPDLPCSVFFEEAEWKALVAYKTKNIIPPEKPPTLRETIHLLASIGGFLGRKSDGEPGIKALWLGLQALDYIADMWKLFASKVPDSNKNLFGRDTCG